MLFNSFEYIFLFLPFSFFIFFYLNRIKLTEASKGFLVLSSLFFYSWWNINYLPLILVSIVFNYFVGMFLSRAEKDKRAFKKTLLIFGILSNVWLLGYYKYSDFFISNLNLLFSSEIPLLQLSLPLAISFFTFQQIAYLVDTYRGENKEYKFLNYAVFVTFFPQLIAGPIVHHKEMMPQFANPKNKIINYKNISLGLFIFSIGLFKKIILADTFSIWATHGFDNAEILTFFEAWATSLSYTFQLYFDFSGYTDMAIGAALLFNIKLPFNFNSPYRSASLIAFWNNWHITLSRFINMYIFKPIVKSFSKYSFTKGMFALFLSMLIAGLWHGASWMFVFFGAIHGLGLIINHIWKKKIKITLHYSIGWFLTFNTINASLIFFRATEWDAAIRVLRGMFGYTDIVISEKFANIFNYINPLNKFFMIDGAKFTGIHSVSTYEMLLLGFLIVMYPINSNKILSLKNSQLFTYSMSFYIPFLFFISLIFGLFGTDIHSEFIYFNF